jgi:hypothetical protein
MEASRPSLAKCFRIPELDGREGEGVEFKRYRHQLRLRPVMMMMMMSLAENAIVSQTQRAVHEISVKHQLWWRTRVPIRRLQNALRRMKSSKSRPESTQGCWKMGSQALNDFVFGA